MGCTHSQDVSLAAEGDSRPRGSRPSGFRVSTHHTLTNDELEKEWDRSAMSLAVAFRDTKCDEHENCDESCSRIQYHDDGPQLISRQANLASILMSAMQPPDDRVIAHDAPRDLLWAQSQKFASLRYQPINSLAGEIRLLKVKKGFFRADVVECELITMSLDQVEDFAALSYCCGPGGMTDMMLCNGQKHCVYTTLINALKAFRVSSIRDKLLWTDAVSIDQANKAELAEQIPLMRRIYTQATVVFVHLGSADKKSLSGLDLMYRLHSIYQHQQDPERLGAISLDDTRWPMDEHPCWKAYLSIFASPWFSRTWILQEIALSKKAIVSKGRLFTTWEVLESSVHAFRTSGFMAAMSSDLLGVLPGILGIMKIFQIRAIAQSPSESSLIEVMRATRNFDVSDARDKVIAILGLVGDLPPTLAVVADYRLTTAEVYHRAAVHLISSKTIVPVLEHAGLQRRIGALDMPTWVPDWATESRKRNEPPISILRPAPFAAGGPQGDWALEEVPYPKRLILLGSCQHKVIILSKVHHVPVDDQEREPHHQYPSHFLDFLDSARSCLNSLEPSDYTYVDNEDAFVRTLMIDDLYTGGNAIIAATSIHDLLPTYRKAIDMTKAAMKSKSPHREYIAMLQNAKKTAAQTCLMQMTTASRQRRFAITDTGYMCLVPALAEIGDYMAIFMGFPTPFLLRAVSNDDPDEFEGGEFRAILIGDAYMHGMMYGEAFHVVAGEEIVPQAILLT